MCHNTFSYASNNPVMFVDPSGCKTYVFYSSGVVTIFYSSMVLLINKYCNLTKRGFHTVAKAKNKIRTKATMILEDYLNFDLHNESEDVTLASNFFSMYKGQLVLRSPLQRSGSFGIMFLKYDCANGGSVEDARNVVRHEHGHYLQMSQMTPAQYFLCYGIPSMKNAASYAYYGDYYNKPWEITADILGGVQSRGHSQRDIIEGFAYLYAVKKYGTGAYQLVHW